MLASVAATEPLPEVFPGAAADGRFAFRRRADGGYSPTAGRAHGAFDGPDSLRHTRAFVPALRKEWRSTRLRLAAPHGFPDAWGTPRRWTPDGPSAFESMRILDPKADQRVLARVQDAFAAAFPALGRPRLRATWAGMIDSMPDVVPVIDRVDEVPGLVLATGFSGHGFGLGPGAGRVVASLVAGDAPGHDLRRFRLARFSDGCRLELGPSL